MENIGVADVRDVRRLAGNDKAGDAWSSSYDVLRRQSSAATADVVNGSYKLASMLLITGDDRARADDYSLAGRAGMPVRACHGLRRRLRPSVRRPALGSRRSH